MALGNALGLPFRRRSLGAGRAVSALDTYSAGLWSAVGIKRLFSSYSGPLIRVRRSNDNAEQDVGQIGGGALDLTGLAAFVGANSAFVVRAYDQSGAGNHFGQTTAGLQPRIVNAGVYDGFIRFDGTDDLLLSVNSMPAVTGITFGGRYSLRAAAVGGASSSIIHHRFVAIAGHSTLVYQQQAATNGYDAYVFEDAVNVTSSYGPVVLTEVADVLIGNKLLSGQAKLALYRGGVLQSPLGGGGTLGTGAFSAEQVTIGGSLDYTQPAPMNAKWFVVYSAEKSAQAAAISGAL